MLGARARDIAAQCVAEALTVALAATTIGLLLAWLAQPAFAALAGCGGKESYAVGGTVTDFGTLSQKAISTGSACPSRWTSSSCTSATEPCICSRGIQCVW